MKKLKLLGSNGVLLGEWNIKLNGLDFTADFEPPIYYPIRSISLEEIKKDEPINKSQTAEVVENSRS